ncbi:MAG: hypothetical protein SWE60_21350, partial [Thermodesulfobacteriota bacterium]|nr:hypothetical protein [Thermodesulfobacteriota bacterium]
SLAVTYTISIIITPSASGKCHLCLFPIQQRFRKQSFAANGVRRGGGLLHPGRSFSVRPKR